MSITVSKGNKRPINGLVGDIEALEVFNSYRSRGRDYIQLRDFKESSTITLGGQFDIRKDNRVNWEKSSLAYYSRTDAFTGDTTMYARDLNFSGKDLVAVAKGSDKVFQAGQNIAAYGRSGIRTEFTGSNISGSRDGTGGDDFLEGSTGKDALYGYGGNDVLIAFDGSDKISGGDGDDVIDGGSSATLWGGSGSDIFRIHNGEGYARIYDFSNAHSANGEYVGDHIQVMSGTQGLRLVEVDGNSYRTDVHIYQDDDLMAKLYGERKDELRLVDDFITGGSPPDLASIPGLEFELTANIFKEAGVPDGLDPEGVKFALGNGKSWGATDQARYDAWAKKDQITEYDFPDGLDPKGVRAALVGGWGDTDQARYDAWAENSHLTDDDFMAAGVPDGLDPEGVKIALVGDWENTDQARYDTWADLIFTDSTVLA